MGSALSRLAGDVAPPVVELPKIEPRREKISSILAARAAAKHHPPPNPFVLPAFPKDALPPKEAQMAMDDSSLGWAGSCWGTGWQWGAVSGIFAEGLAFPGYVWLAEQAQRPEYRKFAEIVATEMTRKWIRLQSSDDDPKTDKINRINERLDHLRVRDVFRRCIEVDELFGRAHLYIDTGDSDNRDELKTSIGNGRDDISKAKIGPGSLEAFRVIEPVWCYPMNYEAADPLKKDWYDPKTWFVMGKELHKTRILKFVGREVPDVLKPAYSFGGLSMTQMAKPYVDNWLRTRQSVSDLLHAFSVFVLKTDMGEVLMTDGDELFKRVHLFNSLRDNRGLMMVNKETEDLANVSAPLGGLSELQAQSQEQLCLSGDTLIETDRGAVEIEKVLLTDKVLTRDGFKPLKWVGCTGVTDCLTEIHTGDRVVRSTQDHPIWCESTKEFVSAKNVSTSHHLLVVRTKSQENTVHQSRGVGIGGGKPNSGITAIKRQEDSFTASFGKHIEDLFRLALKFTIWMKIQRTIAGTISSWSRGAITLICTDAASGMLMKSDMLGAARCVERVSARPIHQPCFVLPPVGRKPIDLLGSFIKRFANAAAMSSKRDVVGTGIQAHHSVRRHVGRDSDFAEMCLTLIMSGRSIIKSLSESTRRFASAAANRLWPRQNELSSVVLDVYGASVTAVRTLNVHPQRVYNLAIDGPPEFFANGILVHNCSVASIPVVKFLGIQPTGLNASDEGGIRVFYDWILASQEKRIRPHLTSVIDFIQLSEFGEIDDDISFSFVPLYSLDEKAEAEVREIEQRTAVGYIDSGVLAPEEIREHLAGDPDSPWASIDVEDVPDLRQEMEMGLTPKGAGRATAELAGGEAEEEGEVPEGFGKEGEEGQGGGEGEESDDASPFQKRVAERAERHKRGEGPFYERARERTERAKDYLDKDFLKKRIASAEDPEEKQEKLL